MPNGRSGGFLLEKAVLARLIASVPHGDSIAHVIQERASPKLTTAGELASLVDKCQLAAVAVEEQDTTAYIIHLSNDPVLWAAVNSDSPIMGSLREHHAAWKRAHPLWKGWVGF